MAGEFDAVYEDGVFRPTGPVDLPPGAAVRVTAVPPPPPPKPRRDPDEVFARIMRIASMPEEPTAIRDGMAVSRNVDAILYGREEDPGDVR